MKHAIDETELARLEALTARHTNVVTLDNVSIPHQIIKAVPALVAEIRRLREDVYALRYSFDCEHEALMRHEHMVVELLEKVEAWAWWDEVAELNEDQFWCSFLSRCAANEMCDTYLAAREAVHADRE